MPSLCQQKPNINLCYIVIAAIGNYHRFCGLKQHNRTTSSPQPPPSPPKKGLKIQSLKPASVPKIKISAGLCSGGSEGRICLFIFWRLKTTCIPWPGAASSSCRPAAPVPASFIALPLWLPLGICAYIEGPHRQSEKSPPSQGPSFSHICKVPLPC